MYIILTLVLRTGGFTVFFKKYFKLIVLIIFIALAVTGLYLIFKNKIKKIPIPQKDEISEVDKAWNNRIEDALKPSTCKDQPKLVYDNSQYQGALIDTHFHISTIPDAIPGDNEDWKQEKFYTTPSVNYTMSDYVCLLKNDGTSGKVFAFFPVYPNIDWQSAKLVKKTMDKYPDVFVPFINAPDGPIGSVDGPTLQKMLSFYPGLFDGLGEQGLYAGDAGPLSPDSERLSSVYPVVRKNNLVVYFHLGEGQADAWEKVLRDNRDITFIWHGDQLVINPQNSRESLKVIEGILQRNPNVYYGIDELYGDKFLLNEKSNKEEVISYIKDNKESLLKKDLITYKDFIEANQDQVLWGTDRGSYLYSLDIELGRTMTDYTRAFIAGLDPAVQEKFAYKNAENLLNKNDQRKK